MGVGDDLEMEHTSAAHEWCLSPTNPVTLAPVRDDANSQRMRPLVGGCNLGNRHTHAHTDAHAPRLSVSVAVSVSHSFSLARARAL